MNVRLLRIESPNRGATSGEECFEVRLLIEVDGAHAWHSLSARPRLLAGFDATLLVASEALQNLFQDEQVALHRICKLVGDELRGRDVRVPQQIAA